MDELKNYIGYDPITGSVFWKESPSPKIPQGAEVGCLNGNGYRCFEFRKKSYKAHRVAWFLVHGTWPSKFIDHINRNRSDNRLENLREADYQENNINKNRNRNNSSGVSGVTWKKCSGKWQARIGVNYKMISLGYFESKEDAIEARKQAEAKYGFSHNFGE